MIGDKYMSENDEKKELIFWGILLLTPILFQTFTGIKVSWSSSFLAIALSVGIMFFWICKQMEKYKAQLAADNDFLAFKMRHTEVANRYQALSALLEKEENSIYKDQVTSLFNEIYALDKKCMEKKMRLEKLESLETELQKDSQKEMIADRLKTNEDILCKLKEEKANIEEFTLKAAKEIDDIAIDFTNLHAVFELQNSSSIDESIAKIKSKSESLRFIQNNIPAKLI